jgi:hypothetical protein
MTLMEFAHSLTPRRLTASVRSSARLLTFALGAAAVVR